MPPTARIEWVPEQGVWKVWIGGVCVGWRRTLLDAEKLGIFESEREEAQAAS